MTQWNAMEWIFFAGRLGSGKDYLARYLLRSLPAKNTMFANFADQLKLETIIYDHVPFEKVYAGNKDSDTRRLLQRRGCELGRDKYGEDIWIRFLEARVQQQHLLNNIERVIVTDLRFPNEVQFALSLPNSKCFYIFAPKRANQRLDYEVAHIENEVDRHTVKQAIANHISETALLEYMRDHRKDAQMLSKWTILYNDPGESHATWILDQYAASQQPSVNTTTT